MKERTKDSIERRASAEVPAPGSWYVFKGAEAVSAVTIPCGLLLGLYRYTYPNKTLLCVGKSPTRLKSRALQKGLIPGEHIWGVFRVSRREFPRVIARKPRSETEQLRRRFYDKAVGPVNDLRRIIEAAGQTLGKVFQTKIRTDLVNEIRRTDSPRGDKPTTEENQRMIEYLRATECKVPRRSLKDLAPEGQAPDRWAKSAGTRLNRFCRRVLRTYRELRGPAPALWTIPTIATRFQETCSLNFPADACPAKAAIRRAKKLLQHKSK